MRWDVLEYGPRRKLVEIWRNDTGVSFQTAGPALFLEATGSGRCYWVPAAAWTQGTTILGETQTAVTNSIDTFRGGPSLRPEHLFRIPTEGADRLFVEWRGEVTADSTGFALQGAPVNPYGPAYWWSAGSAWASGTFIDDPSLGSSYLNQPQNVCWNSTQYGTNAAVPTGLTDATGENPWGIVGGMQLVTRSLQTLDTDTSTTVGGIHKYNQPFANDQRNFSYRLNMGKLTHNGGSLLPVSQGGLLWGYSATNGAAADISRYPKAGDRLGWIYEIGYPKGHFAYNSTSTVQPISMQNLSIKGLSAVYCAFYEIAPATGVTEAERFLSFATASVTVRGVIRIALVYDGRSTAGGIL